MRKKRATHRTALSTWLEKLIADHGVTARQLSEIAGAAPSTLSSWRTGSIPGDGLPQLKRLANHFSVSLSEVLTGSRDEIPAMNSLQTGHLPLYEGVLEFKVIKWKTK